MTHTFYSHLEATVVFTFVAAIAFCVFHSAGCTFFYAKKKAKEKVRIFFCTANKDTLTHLNGARILQRKTMLPHIFIFQRFIFLQRFFTGRSYLTLLHIFHNIFGKKAEF